MLNILLSEQTKPLKPYIQDMCLYNNLNNITIEVGHERKMIDSLFINQAECKNLEDVLKKLALNIYNPTKHKNRLYSTEVLFMDDGDDGKKIASMLETIIDPGLYNSFFYHKI